MKHRKFYLPGFNAVVAYQVRMRLMDKPIHNGYKLLQINKNLLSDIQKQTIP